MLSYKETAHVASFVPCRLARHVVVNDCAVDLKILEEDVLDLA